MEVVFGVVASQYPQGTMKTATTDQGKEFACYANLEAVYGVKVYFANPYSSWQRGSNANGLLREWVLPEKAQFLFGFRRRIG
ncbi:Integrase catalytic region [Paenibacillus algicola]|uniref:Integrase catalytic region n=1 Tax=Paenibacillus algicola TaxID=2565926 RepID=A0A4P8XII2_9BACL|nr:Integrase catalytic region [Paenibacillus algicola]